MRGGWKIAALLAAWAATGLAGCAVDTGDPPGEATAGNGEEIGAEGAAPGAVTPLEYTGPGLQMRKPTCTRYGSWLIEVAGGGYQCRLGDLFLRPTCSAPDRLVVVGSGYLCAHRSFVPILPGLSAPREP